MAADYPGTLPSFASKTDAVDYVMADHINDVQNEIVAIATELGTDPAGDQTDVKTRLAVSLDVDGTLKLTAITEHTGIADNNIVEVDGTPSDDELAEWTADGLTGRVIGIADTNIIRVDGSVADNDYLKATAAGAEGKTLTEIIAELRTAGLIGIGDNDLLEVDGTVAANDILRATANGAEGLTYAELVALIDGIADWDFGDKDIHNMKQVDFQDTHDNGNSGASATINWNEGNRQKIRATAAEVDLSYTDPAGPCHLMLYIIGDGTARTIDADHDGDAEWYDDGEPAAWGSADNEVVGALHYDFDPSTTPKYAVAGIPRGA